LTIKLLAGSWLVHCSYRRHILFL